MTRLIPDIPDPAQYLRDQSAKPDDDIEPFLAALALAALKRPGISTGRYCKEANDIAAEVATRHGDLTRAGAEDNPETRLAALKHVLSDHYGFAGDDSEADSIIKADMIETMDRRRGASIALSMLYLHAGRHMGWDIGGITIPGHFVLRIEQDGKRLIFDPFHQCRILQAADLRALVKESLGEEAELSADYYDPPSNMDIIKRQQNMMKFRQIEIEDYEGALETVQGMRLVDPGECRLLLDAGVLYARAGQPLSAIPALEEYIEKVSNVIDRQDAEMLLAHIKETLE
jgi:regulator of sirC expression with transglutaminase-like and TPR domain